MPINKTIMNVLKHPATQIAGAGLGAGGLTFAGYQAGKRRGSNETASNLASAFSEANQIENQQLAKYFFNKGLSQKGASMDKQSALNDVYNAAFEDEMEKIAKLPGMASVVNAMKFAVGGVKAGYKGAISGVKAGYKGSVSGVKTGYKATAGAAGKVGKAYADSASGLAGEASKAYGYAGQTLKSKANRGFGLSRGAYAKDAGKALLSGVRKGGLALGTAGVAGGAAGFGIANMNARNK